MPKRIAINGFGRIGRLTLRRLLMDDSVEVVAVNDLTDNETLAHLFKYDSAHGTYAGEVSADDENITIDGKAIKALSERDPAKLPWADHNIDIVLECTGIFRNREKAGLHLKAGAKRVIISAPAKGGDIPTIVLGVNNEDIKDDLDILSNASCTTNCFAPVAKLVVEHFGFEQGNLTTTHAYTGDQRIQDAPHSDLRRARAAAVNIVPTTTGAASAAALVVPEIKGKMSALALRVPTITGSLIEFNCLITKDGVTADQVNEVFRTAAEGDLKGILEYSTAPLVSSDIIGNPHSSIFDSQLTEVSGRWLRVVSWYDNEAGYSARLADLTAKV